MVYRDRKRNRMSGYDYSEDGAYFLTLCTYGRIRLFGKTTEGRLTLNDGGNMVQQKWIEMMQFYPNIIVDAFCVMTNHIHAILKIQGNNSCDGTPQRNGTPQGAFPTMGIPDYMDRFKTLTTRLYIDGVRNNGYIPFERHVWQKSYYDHIVRNDKEYQSIVRYILTNPSNWKEDKYYI